MSTILLRWRLRWFSYYAREIAIFFLSLVWMTCNLVLPWASTALLPLYSSVNAIAGSRAWCFCVAMERFGGSAMDTCVVMDEKAFGRGLDLRGGHGVGWPHRMNFTISLTMRLCRSWVGVASVIVGLWRWNRSDRVVVCESGF